MARKKRKSRTVCVRRKGRTYCGTPVAKKRRRRSKRR